MAVAGRDVPPVLLFYHPSMKKLADEVLKIVQQPNRNGRRRKVELRATIRWSKFKDGWPDIFIENVDEVAGRDVIMIASFHSPSVIFEQLSLIYSFPRYLARSFKVILPFFPTATMERIDTEGQIVTAKTLARMLSVIPLAARGPTQIFIFDIHALQERFYFSDQIIPRLLTAIPYLIKELKSRPDCSRLTIAFPDEGAFKRFHKQFDHWPTVTCIKVREGDKRIVRIKDGEPRDRHIVIVDDLVQTGGTLVECAKVLKTKGAHAISLYVTHAVFPEQSWERFTNDKEVDINTFWITDSLPHAIEIAQHLPFKLISLSEAIADSIQAD